MKKYTYVSVIYDDDIVAKTINEPSFYYISEFEDIDIDDKVLVDRNGKEVIGIVIDVDDYEEDDVPFPVEKTKKVIKVIESSSNTINVECPNCGEKMIEIVYGMPSYKLFKNNTIFDNYILSYYPYILLTTLIIFIIILLTKCIKKQL